MVGRHRGWLVDGWMSVPILATLMVNFGSIRVFEPDRSALLRIVVTILIGLMAARLLASTHSVDAMRLPRLNLRAMRFRERPFLVFVLLYGLAIIVSTLSALDPIRSFLG